MKKEEQKIDQYFRDGLRDYESPLAANLWDKLDAAQKEEKKPKGIIWWQWGLGASLLILLITAAFYFLNAEKEGINLPSTDIETESPVTAAPATKMPEQPSSQVVDRDEVVNNNPILTEATDIEIKQNKVLEKQKTTVTTKKSTNYSILDSNSNFIPTILTKTNFKENKNTTNVPPSTFSHTQETKLNSQPITLSTEETSVEKVETTQRLDFLKTRTATLLDDPSNLASAINAPPIKIPFSWGPKGCYSFAGGRIKYDYYVDAFLAPEYAIRKLTAKTPEYENYRQEREDTEAVLYGLSGGVRLSVVTRRGLALRTGIIYNRILERFNLEVEGAERIVHFIPPGTTDTVTTIESGTTFVRTFNRYHSFDIPLLLGYEIDAGSFNFSINAGAYFNVFARQKGKILSQSGEPEFITSNNPQRINAFEKDLGISIYGSIGLNYQIRSNLQLLIEPNFRYQLKPITLESYPLEQQYINVGLLLGVRRQF